MEILKTIFAFLAEMDNFSKIEEIGKQGTNFSLIFFAILAEMDNFPILKKNNSQTEILKNKKKRFCISC